MGCEHDAVSSRRYMENWLDCCELLRNQEEIAKKYEDRFFAAIEVLTDIVRQYDSAPDGPLGNGFTNGPFIAAKRFIGSKE